MNIGQDSITAHAENSQPSAGKCLLLDFLQGKGTRGETNANSRNMTFNL